MSQTEYRIYKNVDDSLLLLFITELGPDATTEKQDLEWLKTTELSSVERGEHILYIF